MQAPVVTIGLGQLGAAFCEGFLRCGHPVWPVLRGQSARATIATVQGQTRVAKKGPRSHGELLAVVVATGEDDLLPVLEDLPASVHDRVVLIQNELRPSTWRDSLSHDPTVVAVWFEKKPGRAVRQVLPSVCSGPLAGPVAAALAAYGVDARPPEPATRTERAHQLALKNLYILALNLGGLAAPPNCTAEELLTQDRPRFDALVTELIALESALSDAPLDAERLRSDLVAAVAADPTHGCAGRSAPRRLERTRALGERHGVAMPALEALVTRNAP